MLRSSLSTNPIDCAKLIDNSAKLMLPEEDDRFPLTNVDFGKKSAAEVVLSEETEAGISITGFDMFIPADSEEEIQ